MMKKQMMVGLTVFVGLVGGALIGPSHAEAQEGVSPATSVMSFAKLGVGPLPGAAILGPLEWERLEEVFSFYAWPMPVQREWPLDDQGQPIVETRRKDEMWHELDTWHNVRTLRGMYRRNTRQLQELNPDVDLRALEQGDRVRIWRRDVEQVPESRGNPRSGRLLYGEPIPTSEDYIVLFPHRAFGTYYAVSETVRILDDYYEAFPGADPLIVGDFSFRTGRAIHPHGSHQSGRDVDLTLPRLKPPPEYDRFHHIRRDNLDGERALWLLTNILEGGYVENIFLDWHHQRTLYRLAKEQGAPQAWLDEVFQYPSRARRGIVRHEPGHATHLHIRFRCQATDRWCR